MGTSGWDLRMIMIGLIDPSLLYAGFCDGETFPSDMQILILSVSIGVIHWRLCCG